eukprot:1573-Pleurochrysis_carterae.AAC.1
MMRRGVQRTRRDGRKKTRYMVYNIGAGLKQYREYIYRSKTAYRQGLDEYYICYDPGAQMHEELL